MWDERDYEDPGDYVPPNFVTYYTWKQTFMNIILYFSTVMSAFAYVIYYAFPIESVARPGWYESILSTILAVTTFPFVLCLPWEIINALFPTFSFDPKYYDKDPSLPDSKEISESEADRLRSAWEKEKAEKERVRNAEIERQMGHSRECGFVLVVLFMASLSIPNIVFYTLYKYERSTEEKVSEGVRYTIHTLAFVFTGFLIYKIGNYGARQENEQEDSTLPDSKEE